MADKNTPEPTSPDFTPPAPVDPTSPDFTPPAPVDPTSPDFDKSVYDETVPGGRIKVGDTFVNADGEPIP